MTGEADFTKCLEKMILLIAWTREFYKMPGEADFTKCLVKMI